MTFQITPYYVLVGIAVSAVIVAIVTAIVAIIRLVWASRQAAATAAAERRQLAFTIAVHRWFANGAGWAYHPALSGWIMDIIRALDDELVAQHIDLPRVRQIPFKGGMLLMMHHKDTDCPDPLARDRNPTILAVVYLPFEVDTTSESRLADQLEHMVGTMDSYRPTMSDKLRFHEIL